VNRIVALLAALCCLQGAEIVEQPFQGVVLIKRAETTPRPLRMHIVKIDLTAPGISFKLTPPAGGLETIRETTLGFLRREHAQVAVNAHFFLPFPSESAEASLVGFAASNGVVYSAFETPVQSYAIVSDAPALNIDPANRAAIVHRDPAFADGKHILESVKVWNAVSGSAQIVTGGEMTIPAYRDSLNLSGLLTPGGPGNYSNSRSWYDMRNARTAIGLSRDSRTLVLFTVDARDGMTVGEVADILRTDYGVHNALNLDGGGSTTLAMQDPTTQTSSILNVSSDNPDGRAVGSNLAVFAEPTAVPVDRASRAGGPRLP